MRGAFPPPFPFRLSFLPHGQELFGSLLCSVLQNGIHKCVSVCVKGHGWGPVERAQYGSFFTTV